MCMTPCVLENQDQVYTSGAPLVANLEKTGLERDAENDHAGIELLFNVTQGE